MNEPKTSTLVAEWSNEIAKHMRDWAEDDLEGRRDFLEVMLLRFLIDNGYKR